MNDNSARSGPQLDLAIARIVQAVEAGEAIPPAGVAAVLQPTIDINPYLCEFADLNPLEDPGSTGGHVVFTVPPGQLWKLYNFWWFDGNTSIDQIYIIGTAGKTIVLDSFTATFEYTKGWDNGLWMPGGWQFKVNVAVYAAGNSNMASQVAKWALPYPGKLT